MSETLRCDICKTYYKVTRRTYAGIAYDLCRNCALGALDAAIRDQRLENIVPGEINRRIEFARKRHGKRCPCGAPATDSGWCADCAEYAGGFEE